jgi:molybdopterin converting factor subunit 1
MVITVRLFAMLKDAAGFEQCQLELPDGADGRVAREYLAQDAPTLSGHLETCRLAINLEYQPWETSLQDEDELCLIPPVSGG